MNKRQFTKRKFDGCEQFIVGRSILWCGYTHSPVSKTSYGKAKLNVGFCPKFWYCRTRTDRVTTYTEGK